jgi:hypothetical protein
MNSDKWSVKNCKRDCRSDQSRLTNPGAQISGRQLGSEFNGLFVAENANSLFELLDLKRFL